MFPFKSKKQVHDAILERIADNLQGLISSVSPTERVAAMAVANALLLTAASAWGKELTHSPNKINKTVVDTAISSLLEQHSRVEEAFKSSHGGSVADPFVSACRWEMVATQVAMITIAVSKSPRYGSVCRNAWKELWKAQRAAPKAVDAIMEYAHVYSVDPFPLPAGKTFNRNFLTALATNLPPMFQQAKKSKVNK